MNAARTGLLLASMTAIFLVIGFLLAGQAGALIALVIAIGMNVFAYWNSDKMVLRMHNAREVDRQSAPDLYKMVEGLAKNANMPMPKVYIINEDQPNAFATGRDPHHAAVAATTGIMRVLSYEELSGVMAHELAHIKNRDTLTMTVAATIAGAIGFISQFAFFLGGSREGERVNPILSIAIMILAPLAASIVQMAISRTREYSADRLGAEICGNPRWLASALEKIESFAHGRIISSAERNPATAHMFIINPLLGGGVSNLFRTHPATSKRIAALLEMEHEHPPRGSGSSSPWTSTTSSQPPLSSRRPSGSGRSGSVPRSGG